MFEAETLAPSTHMGQNVGTEVGHNIDLFSSKATYDYPTRSKSLIYHFVIFVSKKNEDVNF